MARAPVVALEAVSLEFRELRVIERLSFEVAPGELVAIVGPSGCGKSTTLRLAAGLLDPTAGTVRTHGESLQGPIRDAAMVFQAPALLPWRRTVENILLPAEMCSMSLAPQRERALALVRLAGLEGFEKSYPHELSGGMQQRVSLCRALLLEPTLLMMDEPFGALDVLTREKMGFELLRIWQASKPSVLFVTHSISEAVLLADRVLVMSARPGRLKAEIPVDLDRERSAATLSHPRFVELSAAVRAEIERPA